MTTASGILASMASITAALVNLAGTKTTVTLAPVASMASETEPKTGGATPESTSTCWPPWPGFTPPTMLVPEASMSWVCFWPSEPVMPWTMTLESALRKIATVFAALSVLVGGRSQLGGLTGRAVHGLFHRHQGMCGFGEDAAALLDVVAVQSHDQRLGGLVAEDLEGADDAVGHLVTGGDAAEDVDEHRLDVLVAQDDVQTVDHDLGRRAAADVQEVGWLGVLARAAELLTGVGDAVERGHHQSRAVAD